MRKPFFWKAWGAWYVKDDQRSNVLLHHNEENAFSIWEQWRNANDTESPNVAFAVLADLFLCAADSDAEKPCDATVSDQHFKDLKRYLNSYCAEVGLMS